MTNRTFLVGLIMLSCMIQIDCILFKLPSSDPVCLKIPGGNTYVIEYVCSGQNDKNVKMEVFDNNQFVMRKQNTNEFRQTLKFGPGVGAVCFSKTDNRQKSISFDYYPEADPYRQIIDKKDISVTLKSLHHAIASLREVGRNQKFHIQRNQINRSILEQSEHKIKWAGIIKIIFLITSALIQLWIMKSFFNKNSTPYQPVQQNH